MLDNLKFVVPTNGSYYHATFDSSSSFAEIIVATLAHCFPLSKEDANNFCFLLVDDDGKAIDYVLDYNRELLHANIVNLVHIPSIAAQQAVDTIENELNSLNWGQSQCDALNAVLLELTKLLPCRQFATEFIRKGGHEVLFHLVESFDCSDQLPTPADTDRQLDSSPEFDVWSNLVACLVELAEYSINSSELDTDLEQTEAGDDRSSNYSRRISIDSQSSYGDSKDATLMRSASDANMNELFSWHLASKKFISVTTPYQTPKAMQSRSVTLLLVFIGFIIFCLLTDVTNTQPHKRRLADLATKRTTGPPCKGGVECEYYKAHVATGQNWYPIYRYYFPQ